MRIDAHQHFWRYSSNQYDWIDGRMEVLRKDFLPEDLIPLLDAEGIAGSIVIQAQQTAAETDWLIKVARGTPRIMGVVGWADIASESFAAKLDVLSQERKLCGLRHVVQAEPNGFLDDYAFNRGIVMLREKQLVYDVLIYASQLSEATRFIDRHPQQTFVLDHAGKPDIASDGFESWNTAIRDLAKRENIACKISGLVTEAPWDEWTAASLQPYFDTVLESFGPARIMLGSDWPVLTLASSYKRWWSTLANWLEPLSRNERALIEGGTAVRIYALNTKEKIST